MKLKVFSAIVSAMMLMPFATSAESVQHFIINGQSLSTGHQSWPVLSTENVAGNYMLGTEVWTRGGAGYHWNYQSGNSWSYQPLVGTYSRVFNVNNASERKRSGGVIAECPIIGAVNHMQRTFLAGNKILATSVGVSGATVEQLSKGHAKGYYQHFEEAVTKAKEVATAAGDDITCPAIFWMQGEHNYFGTGSESDPTGWDGKANVTDKASYKKFFMQLMGDMQDHVVATYGQAQKPLIITYQAGAQYVRDFVNVGMAQLEAANANADIVMAGPVYPYPDRGGHLDANGYRWYGEMLAKAYYKHLNGQNTTAMQPTKITRSADGKTLRITYYVPCAPMVFDTNIVPEINNYGFNIYETNYGNKKNPTSITIDGNDVVLTFANALTEKIYVTYADHNAQVKNRPNGLNDLAGHGNLRDSDPYQSTMTYVDLDSKDGEGNYIFDRAADESRLRPDYEPKDADGSDLYGKAYPLYNFSVAYCYALAKGVNELNILDADLNPLPLTGQNPGNLRDVYVDEVNGDDENIGSAELPVKTLETAVSLVNQSYQQGKVHVVGTVHAANTLVVAGGNAIEIVGEGNDAEIVSASDKPLISHVNKYTTFRNITLKGFTGRALYCAGGFVTLDNVTFEECTNSTNGIEQDGWGGAALLLLNISWANIDDCKFINNTDTRKRGGAMSAVATKALKINNTVFDGNYCPGDGGAVTLCNSNESPAVIDGCTFSNNVARRGPAIVCMEANTLLRLKNSVFERNSSTFGDENDGGALFYYFSDIEIDGCQFIENKGTRGGAIFVQGADLKVKNTLFDGNMAGNELTENGGQGGVMCLNGASLDADNCVFVNNTSRYNQAGCFKLFGTREGGHFNLTNCDLLDNSAPKDHGGVIVPEMNCTYDFNFVNCTIAGNTNQACGSFAWWLDNWNQATEKQNLNIYNCTFTGNHTNGNTFHSCLLLWNSRIKTHIVNTIMEGNTTGTNLEYSDLHAGEFTPDKVDNIVITNSVIGKFYTARNDGNAPEIAERPTIVENSAFNVSPYRKADGEANHAELAATRDIDGTYHFADSESQGIGMGNDQLLADKYGITTDRFGNERTRNCIGAVEIVNTPSGIQHLTANDSKLAVSRDGDSMVVESELAGATAEVYTIDGRLVAKSALVGGRTALDASQHVGSILVVRVKGATTSRSAVVRF